MLNRNFLAVSVIALTLSSGAAIASPPKGEMSNLRATDQLLLAERGDNEDGLLGKLDLSDSQKQQIQSIRTTFRPQLETKRTALQRAMTTMQTLIQNGNTARGQLETQHNTVSNLRKDWANLQFRQMMDIRDVLTPSQREQFSQHMGEKKGQMNGDRQGLFRR